MLTDSKDKSSRPAARLPGYAWLGIAWLVAGEALLVAGVPIVKQWFTPIMWTGYILLVDGGIRKRKGTSLLSDHRGEFALLALISIASWAIFEGYNVLLKNWTYLNLPDNWAVRNLGYAWAFATISPAMFLTYEWLDTQLPGRSSAHRHPVGGDVASAPSTSPRLPTGVFWTFVVFGLACLIVPLLWPSTYMTPLVWMGFAFCLDPINGRLGERSFLSEFFTGHFRSMPIMFLAGLVCGFLWEFWNYWAATKWLYDVPYLGHVKLFEMPVLGFLGFMPFAVESYAIYVFVRRLIPVKRGIRYLG
jgi:hypothetical protein